MEPLPSGLAEALARPEGHPHDPSAPSTVEWVQTHLSHVFLTSERVYKLRKAVDLGFVDFSTRALRNADCLREVALNRRLAPDVYLGVAPVESVDGVTRLGSPSEQLAPERHGERPEHCVVMRRLPKERDALSLLSRGRLRGRHLDAVARRLASFHRDHGLGRPSPFTPEVWIDRLQAPVLDNLALLEPATRELVPRATWERVRDRAQAFVPAHLEDFEARRREGRVVDGHGDVHLQHVWFETDDAEPLLIDCIEFRDDLRRIDAAAEVAFLAMDLRYRRRPRWAERFLRVYAAEADDFGLYPVVSYYLSYRAAVRAKVASIAAGDAAIEASQRRAAAASARRHLALAARVLDPPGRGAVVLVAGIVGTGKSTAARLLADELGGAVVASDRVRKHLYGLELDDRSGARRGLYGEREKDAVYAALLERADPVVRSGRVAVLDATWSRAHRRGQTTRWARERGLPVAVVELRCPRDVVLERLERRARLGRDASDAGPSLYDASAAAFEAIGAEEAGIHLVLGTEARSWRRELRARSRTLRERLNLRARAPRSGSTRDTAGSPGSSRASGPR